MQTLERLTSLLDHLGIEAAHFATQIPGDIADLAEQRSERIAGLVLCVPTRLDARPFARLASRLLLICGDSGLSAEATRWAQQHLKGARRHVLGSYDAVGWSDVVADRTAETTEIIVRFLTGDLKQRGSASLAAPHVAMAAGSGSHAGLTYRIAGSGPPLVLLPFFLAPSQWEPALAELVRHFTVITLGGPHIGGVAALEDRARAPSYQALLRTLIDLAAPQQESRILDVGCGTGAVGRALTARLGSAARIVAVDVNPFLLRAAAELAAETSIRFAQANALALPFAANTFDCVFSITMLEECDADAAIAEMVRVARPGARIGLVVRAIDMQQWWNLPLPASIRAKAEIPPQSVAPRGVADASLYARMRRAGLVDLRAFPTLLTLAGSEGPIWRYREYHVLSQLSQQETDAWYAARAAARKEGLLMQAHALHCAVATKRAAD